ncbi:hypothetical protein HW532_16940 [Kaustia mangrovi]|uniref:Uncharacterized protein n=1 Tax=Kaustia mangrovi TaxID=2593653 RepID=A0A7S8HD40_9HYPH|nr:hypothetical protein [Kaustia mangrovi]QPC44235.1 hypothetical protein HW532_16940 [Kaustia mangrovi]
MKNTLSPDSGGRLDKALRQARLVEAEHLDALFDIRDAKQLRLVTLKDELEREVAGRSEARELFDLSIAMGEPPRLWIDMVSYVTLEPDPRTYRLVQDTRDGRVVLFESGDRAETVERVVQFMAHRMVERERAKAGAAPEGRVVMGYSGVSLLFAGICGFALGALGLLALGVLLSPAPF